MGRPQKRYLEIRELLEESPLPWHLEMIADWFGYNLNVAEHTLYIMRTRGLASFLGERMFWSASHQDVTRDRLNEPKEEPEIAGPRISDEMLARYGYNL